MAIQLMRAKAGFSDGSISYLSGVAAPGGDASFQDAAGIGSIYSNTTTGVTYRKNVAGAGTANWQTIATTADLAGLTANQSWREPVLVRDGVSLTAAAAIVTANVADTIDGIAIAVGDRVLLSAVAGGAGPNVYIVGGSTGAWTLTEDVNLETAGDTLQVLQGTSANQIWLFDGTVWSWIGAQSSSEDGFQNAFMGKAAVGNSMPAFTSTNYVVNGTSLETAIGALDAQSALNALAASNASTAVGNVQAELNVTQTGAGLSVTGSYVAPAGTTYLGTATSLANADVLLDTAINNVNGTLTNHISSQGIINGNVQTEIDAIEASAGTAISATGTWVGFAGTNYINASTSLTSAITLLDTQINTNAQAISTEITNRGIAVAAVDVKVGTAVFTGASATVLAAADLTAAVVALDARIDSYVAKTTAVATVNAVVDSVLVDSVDAVKWFVSVSSSATPSNRIAVELFAAHNGTGAADATVADATSFAELELGAAIPGLVIDAVLSGAGVTQSLGLVVTATGNVDIKATRLTV